MLPVDALCSSSSPTTSSAPRVRSTVITVIKEAAVSLSRQRDSPHDGQSWFFQGIRDHVALEEWRSWASPHLLGKALERCCEYMDGRTVQARLPKRGGRTVGAEQRIFVRIVVDGVTKSKSF